ncbi:CapA family protein [bacterium]|nr:CapA family protein [bacterium]
MKCILIPDWKIGFRMIGICGTFFIVGFSAAQTPPDEPLRIVAVGDIMLGTDYPSSGLLPPGADCRPLLMHAREFLIRGDLTFGNLEGTFAGPYGLAKQCEHCYAFRMPENFVDCLSEAGFDLLSLANNHAMDFGRKAAVHTQQLLSSQGIMSMGFQQSEAQLIGINGITVGFCAFAYSPGMCDINDLDRAAQIIQSAVQKTDLVIVSFHGGAEGPAFQHVPRKTEYFLNENRGDVYRFSHSAVDAGADIVLGHGPHVPRGLELYRDRLIAYSLGNFCTYNRFNLREECGIAPLLEIEVARDGRFLRGQIVPFVQKGQGIPEFDSGKRAVALIRELTRSDFPDTPLQIADGDSAGIILPVRPF